MRFLAFNTVIDIEAYGETAACQTAFEEVRALCRLYERLFSRTLPHSDIARINSAHGQPVAIDPLPYDPVSYTHLWMSTEFAMIFGETKV